MNWRAATVPWAVGALIGVLVVVASSSSFDRVGGPQAWVLPATIAVATAIVGLLPHTQAVLPHKLAMPALLFGALVAMYGCVPETDQIPPVAMLLLALAVIELIAPGPLPWTAHACGVGVVLWAGVYGATGRESALVGALFALWPLLLLPLVSLAVRWTSRLPLLVRWIIAAQATIATLIVARSGALEPTVRPALRAVLAWGGASAAAAVLLALIARPLRRPR